MISPARKLLTLAMALGCLSYLGVPEAHRTLACASCMSESEPLVGTNAARVPLQKALFANIENAEVRQNSENWYLWLSGIELDSLRMQQQARSVYGLGSPLFVKPAPFSIAQFNPNQPDSFVASSDVWSAFIANPLLGKIFPSTPRLTVGSVANAAMPFGSFSTTLVSGGFTQGAMLGSRRF